MSTSGIQSPTSAFSLYKKPNQPEKDTNIVHTTGTTSASGKSLPFRPTFCHSKSLFLSINKISERKHTCKENTTSSLAQHSKKPAISFQDAIDTQKKHTNANNTHTTTNRVLYPPPLPRSPKKPPHPAQEKAAVLPTSCPSSPHPSSPTPQKTQEEATNLPKD